MGPDHRRAARDVLQQEPGIAARVRALIARRSLQPTEQRSRARFGQDTAECSWAGPSWPYETSRVLTGLSNFLADYPPAAAQAAGMSAARFTTLLRTYAKSMTRSRAANGSKRTAAPTGTVVSADQAVAI